MPYLSHQLLPNTFPEKVNDDYNSVVEAELNMHDFQIVDYSVIPINEKGIGFMGVYSILKFKVKASGTVSELQFFEKRMPTDTAMQDLIQEERFWVREPLMYLEILKELQPLVQYKLSARCYLARPKEVIILEDLAAAGYRNNKQELMDLGHCKVALECLANFHSASIIFEEKNNVRIDQLHPDIIKQPRIVHAKNVYSQMANNTARTIQKLYDFSLLDINQEDLESIKLFIRKWPSLFKTSTKIRSVVSHKDPWNNNFMFSYDEEGNAEKACLIDFQTSSYLPPGCDVMMLIYLNTSQQFRNEHQKQLVDHYYHHLSTQLNLAGLDSDMLLSRDQFTESCRQALPLALVTSIAYWMLLVKLPPASLASVMVTSESFLSYMLNDSKDIVIDALKADEKYKTVVTDCLQQAKHFLKKENR